MRAADTVARLGGDEFAVILDERRGAAASRSTASSPPSQSPFEVDGRSFPVTRQRRRRQLGGRARPTPRS